MAAEAGAEELRGREEPNTLYTLELGPGKATLTLLPEKVEGREEVNPAVLRELGPTAYCVPMGNSNQLDRAMEHEPDEFLPFANSIVRLAHQEGRSLFMTFGSLPTIVLDVPPETLMANKDIARLLSAGAFVLVAGHMLTKPAPETVTRRNLLAGGAAAATVAALYMTFREEGANPQEVEELQTRLSSYAPEQQAAVADWYRLLRGFSNLILARQLHEIARLRGGQEDEHVVALAPPENAGLRAALLIPHEEREALIEDFIANVLIPVFEAGGLNRAEYEGLLAYMTTIIEAKPGMEEGVPTWDPTYHEVPSFAEQR